MDKLKTILDWVQMNVPPWLYITAIVVFVVINSVAYLILLERKVASWAQDRIGPNRVGLDFGLTDHLPGPLSILNPLLRAVKTANGFGQPLADGVKFIVKEDYAPGGVDVVLFSLAPALMITVIIISLAALPWGGIKQSSYQTTVATRRGNPLATLPTWIAIADAKSTVVSRDPGTRTTTYNVTYRYPLQIANLNIGVLFILATLSLAVYGVVIGGWASNNKYSFLGGLRATVNMISCEIPMGLAVLCLVLMFGTLDLSRIIEVQCHYWFGFIPAWNCFSQPLPFVMFLICIHAEANRAPFDLAEAEQELVGGYHTEYSSMRFALFFLAEYAGMITTSAVCVALFLGGWHLPWVEWAWKPLAGDVSAAHPAITTSLIACLVRAFIFFGKTVGIIFVFMWVRWSLPRFRFDQLMMLAWRGLIPIALALLMMTAGIVYAFGGQSSDVGISTNMAIWCLAVNVATAAVILIVSTVLPAAPMTNRRVTVSNSRYNKPALQS
jgi:NADH-quinone oxidoreductase subunit H